MSDTTTITPEERANLRRLAGAATPRPWKMRKHCDESAHMEVADSVGIVCTTPFYGFEYPEQWTNGEYIAAACNAATRLLDALEAAEAESARLRAERDWLAENAVDRPCAYDSCPFGLHRPTGPDDDDCDKTRAQCWTEAARRAVADAESEVKG